MHYNFPSFCIQEVNSKLGISRREYGHGQLALNSIKNSICKDEIKDKTIRIVSDIIQSDGSSSMGTVCGASLALRCAGFKNELISGIAMGLVYKNDKNYQILTDINSLEDFHGDLDLKISGASNSISSIEVDNKIYLGFNLDILKKIIKKGIKSKDNILKSLNNSLNNIKVTNSLGFSKKIDIEDSLIPRLIGKSGSNIKQIVEKFGVNIDINKKTNDVKISSKDEDKIDECIDYIHSSLSDYDQNRNTNSNQTVKKMYFWTGDQLCRNKNGKNKNKKKGGSKSK